MTLLVVVLAGGAGKRIGGGKRRRRLAGERLVDRAIALARQWSDEIAVAVGESPDPSLGGVRQLLDRQGAGPVAGLLAGVREAVRRGLADVLTIPCDTPFLPADLAQRLASARTADGTVTMPQVGAQLHPGCALWPADCEPAILAHLAEGRRSLVGLAERIGYAPVRWPEDCPAFFNINSRDDLARAEAILKQS